MKRKAGMMIIIRDADARMDEGKWETTLRTTEGR